MKTLEWTNEFGTRYEELINDGWIELTSTYQINDDMPLIARLQKVDSNGIKQDYILVEEEKVKEKKEVNLYDLKVNDEVWIIHENTIIKKIVCSWGICINEINKYVKNGNCFKSEIEAKIELQKRQVKYELKKFSFQPNWNDSKQIKFNIYYCYDNNEIRFNGWYTNRYDFIYFESKEIAEQAIKEVGEERVKAYLKGELYA